MEGVGDVKENKTCAVSESVLSLLHSCALLRERINFNGGHCTLQIERPPVNSYSLR